MRSKLFVPGSRPELFAKALASHADGLSLDLEDAVAESLKDQARQALGTFIGQAGASHPAKTLIVRVNPMDTSHFAADIDAVVRPGLHAINLPKPESIDSVKAAIDAIKQAERAHGVTRPIGILINIESPWALRHAAELALCDARIMGLQLGLGDLFEPYGITRTEPVAVHQAMFAVVMGAAEAGVAAYDSAYANIADAQGFREEAEMARRLGFQGKSCIHPNQVALANAAFCPSEHEIAHALEVVKCAEVAHANGVGAYKVQGKMIDAPFERRANAIVKQARQLGLIDE